MVEETKQDSLAVAQPKTIEQVFPQTAQSVKLTRIAAFTPANLTEAIALAKLLSRSELCPKEYRGKPENILFAMQYAAELGVPVVTALSNISIINGRASLWGDLFLGVIQTSPHYEWHKEFEEGSGETFTAVCIMKRNGHEPHTVKFSVNDAKTARLWGKEGTWKTNPKRMLQMRARGFAGRDKFSDALKGLIMAEEAMDLPVDTSEAKKARESGTLDIGTTGVGALVPSTEPNRGHEDTGLGKAPDSQNQPDPKPDNVMCSECRKINGHEESCSQFVKAKQDAKTSHPTTKVAVLVVKTRKKKKKEPPNAPYLILDVVYPNNKEDSFFVWHQSFHQYLADLTDKSCLFEISTQGKYLVVEHILEVAGVAFVNDKPAEQGTMPPAESEPGADDENW